MTATSRRLLIITAAVLAALGVAVGAAAAWWRWDTQRQPKVDDVVAEMNTAVVDTVVAAGQDAAVAVSPVVRSAECRLGVLRQGGVFAAKADLYTNPGNEDSLITSIEQRLPARYSTTRGPVVAGVRPLLASTGVAITLSVRRLSPGWLTVLARSGCSLGTTTEPAAPTGPAAGATALADLLHRLGTRPATITEHRLPCANGQITTIAATSDAIDTSNLNTRLAGIIPETARRFSPGESNRITYRDGTISVIIAASDDGTAVSAQHTTGC